MKSNRYMIYSVAVLMMTVVMTLMSSCCYNRKKPLQVIFTNDSHSQVEALRGRGGFEARAWIIDSLREENPNTLLLDAGDMFQGTPYFNLFHGKVEVEAYNLMGYDAVTLGNHEFDYGIDTLAARLEELNCPVVNANYYAARTPLEKIVQPYVILNKGGWRVGVIGIGVDPNGLILASNFTDMEYLDPIALANRYAKILKTDAACDLVILLSHLGYGDGDSSAIYDEQVAANSRYIDVILGGHTHPVEGVFSHKNRDGKEMLVMQSGKSGLNLYSFTITQEH